jgi:hypothetical protein
MLGKRGISIEISGTGLLVACGLLFVPAKQQPAKYSLLTTGQHRAADAYELLLICSVRKRILEAGDGNALI